MFTWLAVLMLAGGVVAAVRRVLAAGRTPLDGRRSTRPDCDGCNR